MPMLRQHVPDPFEKPDHLTLDRPLRATIEQTINMKRPLSIFEPVWLLQTNANSRSESYEFDLSGALPACIERGGLMWLSPRAKMKQRDRASVEIARGHAVFLWECGLVDERGTGRLVAFAIVERPPEIHEQFEWQKAFRNDTKYDPAEDRILLRVCTQIEPPVWRNRIKASVIDETLFFRQPQRTTYLLEPDFISALASFAGVRELPSLAAGEEDSGVTDRRRRRLRNGVERPGQPRFRWNVSCADEHRCVVTGTDVEECLEAAHIIPYLGSQTDRTENGVLLRADIHKLYDAGLLRIHPITRQVWVHSQLTGTEYERYVGIQADSRGRLDQKSLDWRWNNPKADPD